MDNREAIHKLEFMRNAYQKLIDEKVDSGRLVGTDVTGTWKAETPLNDAYQEHIDALTLAIAALEQQERNRWVPCSERLPEVGQRVLVEFNDGSMSVLRCNDAGHLQCFYARTVAWRPAPERYHEGEV